MRDTRMRGRSGFSAMETIVGVVVLSFALILVGKMTGVISQQRRTFRQRQAVMEAQANLMSLAMSLRYDQLTPERLETLAREFDVFDDRISIIISVLPAAEIGESPKLQGKRVSLSPSVDDSVVGGTGTSLVAWKYPSVDADDIQTPKEKE